MKTQIVFLMGISGSGKDTIGDMFVKEGFVRVAFADAAKEEFAKLINIDVNILHQQGEEKEKHRPALIKFAETRKHTQPTYWVDKAFEPYRFKNGKWKDDYKLIVTDFRRTEEIEWLYRMLWEGTNIDKYLFYIERPDITDPDGVLNQRAIAMALGIDLVMSTALGKNFIDEVIVNDKDIETLQLQVGDIIKDIQDEKLKV